LLKDRLFIILSELTHRNDIVEAKRLETESQIPVQIQQQFQQLSPEN
jgi:hypothetical protein